MILNLLPIKDPFHLGLGMMVTGMTWLILKDANWHDKGLILRHWMINGIKWDFYLLFLYFSSAFSSVPLSFLKCFPFRGLLYSDNSVSTHISLITIFCWFLWTPFPWTCPSIFRILWLLPSTLFSPWMILSGPIVFNHHVYVDSHICT